ncbi:MAG: hypothetical protein AB7O37_22610 [Vicinamibacteria bacterium]
MPPAWKAGAAALAVAFLCAAALARLSPQPVADVSHGSEDAFVVGLHLREFQPGSRAPLRWTGEQAVARFRDLPPGPRRLRVELAGHRSPVTVVAAGAIVGTLAPGARVLERELPPSRESSLDVELRVDPFVAGDGRRLGTSLTRVAITSPAAAGPSARLVLAFALPALLATAGGIGAGLAPLGAFAQAAALSMLQAALLWPFGLVRSPEPVRLAIVLTLAAVLAAAGARLFARRGADAARWAYRALLVAGALHLGVALSPLLVASDVVFHANKLGQVAAGELFPVSLTQHATPFRFPYGVSFYLLLAPLLRAGLDPVALVRWGAGLSAFACACATFAFALRRGPRLAGLATLLLQLVPIGFDVHSFGNLSNVFGQATGTAFLAWWLGPARHPLLGAALVLVTCLAHLSSFVVLVAFGLALAALRARALAVDHARRLALLAGFGAAALYYSGFARLVIEQLPRLAEGGSGRGTLAPLDALLAQLGSVRGQWGLPLVALALAGVWGARVEPGHRHGLLPFWVAGLALLAVATFSPLEVRYLYALSPLLALEAAAGLDWLLGRPRLRAVGWLLVLGAGWSLAALARDALLSRYRP